MDTGSVRLQRIWALTMSRWAADSNTSSKRVEQCGTARTHPRLVILLLRHVQNTSGKVCSLPSSKRKLYQESGKPWLNQGIALARPCRAN